MFTTEYLCKKAERAFANRKPIIITNTTPEVVHVFTNQRMETKAPQTFIDVDSHVPGNSNNIYADIIKQQDKAVGILINSKYYNVYNYKNSALLNTMVNLNALGNYVVLYDMFTKTWHHLTPPSVVQIYIKRSIQSAYLAKKYNGRITDPVLQSIYKWEHTNKIPTAPASLLDLSSTYASIQDIMLSIEQIKLEREFFNENHYILKQIKDIGLVLPEDTKEYDMSVRVANDINVHMDFTEDNTPYVATSSKRKNTTQPDVYVTTEAFEKLNKLSVAYYKLHGIEPDRVDMDDVLNEFEKLDIFFKELRAHGRSVGHQKRRRLILDNMSNQALLDSYTRYMELMDMVGPYQAELHKKSKYNIIQ